MATSKGTKKVEVDAVVKESVKTTPASEGKTENKAPAKKATTKKADAPKAEAKKAPAKKAPAKKATTKKVNKVLVQFNGAEYDLEKVQADVMAAYTAETKKKTATSVEIYVKPVDGKAYYVVDGIMGAVEL